MRWRPSGVFQEQSLSDEVSDSNDFRRSTVSNTINTMSAAVLAALASMLCVSGMAADNPPRDGSAKPEQRSFEILDQNKDGKISAAEAREDKSLSKLFSGLDGDKDGAISREEFAAYDPASAAKGL